MHHRLSIGRGGRWLERSVTPWGLRISRPTSFKRKPRRPMSSALEVRAHEFNIVEQGQALAAMLMTLNDIRSVGLDAAQGIYLSEAFYWDLNDGTRAWAKRFAERNGGKYPNMVHAG